MECGQQQGGMGEMNKRVARKPEAEDRRSEKMNLNPPSLSGHASGCHWKATVELSTESWRHTQAGSSTSLQILRDI